MRFYRISPSELAGLSDEDVRGLIANMPRISARERVAFILDIMAAMPSDAKEASHYLITLVNQAYADDPESHAIILEAVSRR